MSWTAWEAYASVKLNWDLADAATGGTGAVGVKTAYVRYRDVAGNESTSSSDIITYNPPDITPPYGSILIDSGNASTQMTLVTLTLSAADDVGGSGLADLSLSNDGTSWSLWEVFAVQRTNWDLSDMATGGSTNQGTKTVYIRFRDVAGNISTTYTDTIDYFLPDTTPPTGSIQINGGASTTNNAVVTINCSAQDEMNGSGIQEMRFSNDNMNWSAWGAYASSLPNWDLTDMRFGGTSMSGTKTVYAIFRDLAGNESMAYSASINWMSLDTAPPTQPLDLVATPASSSQIVLSWTESSDDVGVKHYHVQRSVDGMSFTVTATISTGAIHSDLGLDADTTYFYRVQAFDAAGNESPVSDVVSATTLMDTPGFDAGFIDVGFVDAGLPADSSIQNPDSSVMPEVDSGTSSSTTGNNGGTNQMRQRNNRIDADAGCSCKTSAGPEFSVYFVLLLLGAGLCGRRRKRG